MANPEITNNNTTELPVFNPIYEPSAVINFSGAGTYAKGVIMGKIMVEAGAVTPGTNTGNGTCTAFDLAAPGGLALIGDYNLECITAVANGGVFKLEDPNGNLLANDITIPAGAGNDIVYVGNGLTFTITDGTTDFQVGDSFALTVSEVNKWSVYVEGAVDGTGIAKGILPIAVTATGSGDLNRAMIIGGEIAKSLVTVNAGGSIPLEAIEQLKDAGITLRDAMEASIYDNS